MALIIGITANGNKCGMKSHKPTMTFNYNLPTK